jgi:ApaG protein
MYTETTQSIVITVHSKFLTEESFPNTGHYTWSYHVEIHNEGKERVQLINRYWNITDANGQVKEVRGEGVVGAQPVLSPGEGFEYTSFVPLSTPSGMMSGTYEMLRTDGTMFNAVIPAFSLDSPDFQPSLN